jgi:hypothetical protein
MSEEKLLKSIEVAYELKVTVPTLTNWYNWYEGDYLKPEDTPELPKYVRKGTQGRNNHGARYWKKSDVEKLKKFQAWIKKGRNGPMAEYNKRFWVVYNRKQAEKENKNV